MKRKNEVENNINLNEEMEMNRHQRRFQERQNKKDAKNKYSWKEKSPVEVHSSFYFENPIVFFEKLSDRNGVLSNQKLTEFKEYLKLGKIIIFGGTMSGIRTLIGWNNERNGWFFFREPMVDNEFVYAISPELHSPEWCDGDGVSTWCIPPKKILDVWNIKEVA
jgi:hypothetical protein